MLPHLLTAVLGVENGGGKGLGKKDKLVSGTEA